MILNNGNNSILFNGVLKCSTKINEDDIIISTGQIENEYGNETVILDDTKTKNTFSIESINIIDVDGNADYYIEIISNDKTIIEFKFNKPFLYPAGCCMLDKGSIVKGKVSCNSSGPKDIEMNLFYREKL